jgi:hypothetical protein
VNQIPTEKPIEVPLITDEQFVGMDPDGRHRIYLGTFDDQRSMQNLMKHPLLQGKTFSTALRQVSSDIFWYRLTAGEYQSREEAIQVLSSLKQQGVLPAFAASP